jgi:coenzyme F420-reducing hydrogenase beta subunit
MQACKQGAIHSELSDEGFTYPVIDRSKCISCQVCIKICPILNLKPPFHYNSDSRCYSAYQKHIDVRKRSSSGGMFYTLAKYVLSEGGVVYGAAWTSGLHLKHIEAKDEKSLEMLLRSKYVQSDTSEVYAQVKKRLDDGMKVLFCGTPCQVAAMKSFLRGKEYKNLLLVDVICQGVPSPTIFRKYIDEIEEKYRTKIVDVIFRSKKYGWRSGLLLLLLLCEDGRTIEIKYKKNTYYRAFLNNFFMRESCYECQFKSSGKGCFSDISLADYWRIGTNVPYQCSSYESGISAVLTNTPKGEVLFDAINKDIVWERRSYGEFSTNDGVRVAKKPMKWKEAFNTAANSSFDNIQKIYYPYSWRHFLSDWLSIHFSQQTLNLIRKWLRR